MIAPWAFPFVYTIVFTALWRFRYDLEFPDWCPLWVGVPAYAALATFMMPLILGVTLSVGVMVVVGYFLHIVYQEVVLFFRQQK